MAAQLHGSLGATGSIRLGESGEGTVTRWVIQLSGTFVGTLIVEAIVKGTNPALVMSTNKTAIATTNMTSGSVVAGATGYTAPIIFWVDATGLDLQVTCSAYTSGTLVVDGYIQRG